MVPHLPTDEFTRRPTPPYTTTRRWLARHWTDPYPEEAELEALATETGLPADQVRVRVRSFGCSLCISFCMSSL